MSNWKTLIPEQLEEQLQHKPAIYVLYIKGKLHYIGSTINAWERVLLGHFWLSAIKKNKKNICRKASGRDIYVKVRYVSQGYIAFCWEQRLIRKLNPTGNKQK